MINRLSFKLENKGHACYFAVRPGSLTSVMALATLWAPLHN